MILSGHFLYMAIRGAGCGVRGVRCVLELEDLSSRVILKILNVEKDYSAPKGSR